MSYLNSGIPNIALHKNGVGIMGKYDETEGGLLQVAGKKILTPYVLYQNLSGNNGTVTLSDNVSNYDYIEIFYMDNVSIQFSTRFIPNGVSLTCSLSVIAIDNGADLYAKNGQKTISGNTITAYHVNAEAHINNNVQNVYSGSNYIKITKVLGYK